MAEHLTHRYLTGIRKLREPVAQWVIERQHALIDKLQRSLGARVDIKDKKGKGKIEISYTSYDELDTILNRIFR